MTRTIMTMLFILASLGTSSVAQVVRVGLGSTPQEERKKNSLKETTDQGPPTFCHQGNVDGPLRPPLEHEDGPAKLAGPSTLRPL